jgi:hypothetical protein
MKTFLAIASIAVVPLWSYSQGQFSFNNFGVNGSPITPIYGPEAGNPRLQKWGNAADASPPWRTRLH